MNVEINEAAQKVAASVGVCETVPPAVTELSVQFDVTLLMVKGSEIGQLVKLYRDQLIRQAFPKLVNVMPVSAFAEQFGIDKTVFSPEELQQKAIVLQKTKLAGSIAHKDLKISVRF